jgi:hypothetical protein
VQLLCTLMSFVSFIVVWTWSWALLMGFVTVVAMDARTAHEHLISSSAHLTAGQYGEHWQAMASLQ